MGIQRVEPDLQRVLQNGPNLRTIDENRNTCTPRYSNNKSSL